MSDKTVLIIQARMGSTRLPGKSMMPLYGEPLVGRILERVSRCTLVDDIVLATTTSSQDDALADIAAQYQVGLFRGSENDVLARYYFAANSFNASTIVRLPGDNPVPEPLEIDRIISHHHQLPVNSFSSNLSPFWSSGYPDGICAEVFHYDLLKYAYVNHSRPDQREHVHLNFFDYSTQQPYDDSWCKVSTVSCPHEFSNSGLVLDVNTYEQYRFISELYESLYPVNPQFTILDIVDWHKSRM